MYKENVKDNIILEGLEEGKTKTQIALEVGLTPGAISIRIKNMREAGIEIPKPELDLVDKKIIEKLSNGEIQRQIAKEMGLSEVTISVRVKKMREKGVEIPNPFKIRKMKKQNHELYKHLAAGIINLIKTRNATLEQIQILAEYYGLNIEEIMNSLDKQAINDEQMITDAEKEDMCL